MRITRYKENVSKSKILLNDVSHNSFQIADIYNETIHLLEIVFDHSIYCKNHSFCYINC